MKLIEALREKKRIKRRAQKHFLERTSFSLEDVLADDWEVESPPYPPYAITVTRHQLVQAMQRVQEAHPDVEYLFNYWSEFVKNLGL